MGTVKRPEGPFNVILISFDTLRRDFCSCYGYRKKLTPALDKIAREGVQFMDGFVNCGWTLPQHLTMVTGTNPIHHMMIQLMPTRTLPDEIPTLPEIFQKNGYVTIGIGNANKYGCKPEHGYRRGMNYYTNIFPHNNMMEMVLPTFADTLRLAGDLPFFMYFNTNDTHEPFAPSEPYLGKYGKKYVNRYEGQINYCDHYLGEMMKELRSRQLDKKTLIVFTSDHGTEFEEHGSLEKKLNLYEEIMQIPLVMKLPGVLPAGKKVTGFCQSSDFAPTILDLCSIDIPDIMDGRSLVPQIKGRKKDVPETIFAHTYHERTYNYESFSARTNRYKLIRTTPMVADPTKLETNTGERFARMKERVQIRGGVWRDLYDLKKDPGEQNNIIADQPEVARDLEIQLKKWIRQNKYTPVSPVKTMVRK